MEDFAEMLDLEIVVIDANTRLGEIKNTLRWNDVYYRLRKEY
jgi:L-arabinose isomerase